MKFINTLACCMLAVCCCFFVTGCSCGTPAIVLGTYDETEKEFTKYTGNDYSLEIVEKDIVVKGEIPEIGEGHGVAIQFNSSVKTDADDTEVKIGDVVQTNATFLNTTTNSFVVVVMLDEINKTIEVEITIKWNETADAVTYKILVDEEATFFEETV
ncbi:MAG: hypothetical protein PHX09_00010 [Clostridia bacterium]|nr:hypothetical protein [Clostridia bacterium]MDD4686245.1 hypothetical protein [Clostridia bacterium]